MKIDQSREFKEYIRQKYGLFVYVLTKFSRTSTYPHNSLQDFKAIMKLFRFEKSQKFIEDKFPKAYTVSESGEPSSSVMDYFPSEIEIFKTLIRIFDFEELKTKVQDLVMPRVGEYLWDHFYDGIWENDNRQVMNLIFMNLKIVKDIHRQLVDVGRDQYIQAFHKLLEQKCPGEDWENYRDISPEEYSSFYYKSKI